MSTVPKIQTSLCSNPANTGSRIPRAEKDTPMDFIEIGATPGEADCAQVGKDGYHRLARIECNAYIVALTRYYGTPPEGSRFSVHSNPHDFGSYLDVRYVYDSAIPEHVAHAIKVENGLRFWAEAGMWSPVKYDDKGRTLHVIEDPELWIEEDNPDCHATKALRDAAIAAKT
jgi:hypothetical protein